LPYSMLYSKHACPFCCGGQAGVQLGAANPAHVETHCRRGATQALLMNQGTMIAEKNRSKHGTVAHGRAVEADFISYQSSVVQVLIHAASFAMLSLTAVMVLGCVLAI
jgi:hypothetical protein